MSANPDHVEFDLERPVFSGGRYIRKLRMRRATADEMEVARITCDEPGARGLAIIAMMTGMGPRTLLKLSEADLLRIETHYDALTAGDIACEG